MKYLAALFAVFIVIVIALADANLLGFLRRLYDFPNGDKMGHLVLFGILSFLVNRTALRLPRLKNRARTVTAATLLLALLIGLEEWSQRWFPNRTSDWVDLACSYLGVALGAWIAFKSRGTG